MESNNPHNSTNNNNNKINPNPTITTNKTSDHTEENPDDLDNILDKAMEGADEKLNLTADDNLDDANLGPELEKEYEEFMKSLNQEQGSGIGNQGQMKDFASLMTNLLDGLKNDPEMGKEFEELKKKEGQVGGNNVGNDLGQGNLDDLAQKLLKEFMDKEVLLEPLQEAEKSYVKYLSENAEKLDEVNKKNYEGQLACVREILVVLDKDPNNKDKMIELFEKMHDCGNPPEGILNPLSKFPGMPGGFGGSNTGSTQPEGFGEDLGFQNPEEMLNNMEKMMGQNPENCNIF